MDTRRQTSIADRVVFASVAIVLMSIVIAGLWISSALKEFVYSENANHVRAKSEAARHLVDEDNASNTEALTHQLLDLTSGHPDLSIVLTLGNKRLVIGAGIPVMSQERDEPSSSTAVIEIINGKPYLTTTQVLPANPAQTSRRLTTVLALEPTLMRLRSYNQILVQAGVLALVAVIGFALIAARWTVRPLADLARASERLDPANLNYRIQIDSREREIQLIKSAINGALDKLQVAYEQTEAFNADVAHELRTPLAVTKLALQRAMDSTDNAEVLELLEECVDKTNEAARIVTDMLFLSQAERGAKARLTNIPNARALLLDVTDFWEAVAAEATLVLRVDGGGPIRADADLLRRAVSNLVANAIRFARRDSVITVAVNSTDDIWRISVANAGKIPTTEVRNKMFNRFFHGKEQVRSFDDNYGLGLAIVKAIAKMHEGQTWTSVKGDEFVVGMDLPKLTKL
jgi:two-component system, OmpR family, heavy metal sensor histidine kinase CusS